jgi:hypothetical protein
VNASQIVRPVNTQLLGVNTVWWDTSESTSQTEQMVESAGLNLFRLPGGSSTDDFHFNAPPNYQGKGTIPSMASFVAAVNGNAVVTLDYGSGSPQEAAAELAYLNAPVGSTTPIGDGLEWNDTTGTWQTVNWQTAGYWASLRAAQPLAVDDGLNFMRLGRTAPFGFTYFEVGNEEYGGWEIDHHTAQHDPTTYVTFAKQFQTYAASIDPSISIGIDAGSPDNSYNNWLPGVLQQAATQGLSIGFISDHNYVQAPESESDSTLLTGTVSDPSSPYDWAVRATDYTNLLDEYLGSSAASKVELLTTEFNSVYSNPGKQTTSLVNGLFVADSLGALLETPYQGAVVWDLRNGFDTSNNNSSSLYGWRDGGDYGLLGSSGTAPETGTYVPYPTYFAEQLASKIIVSGGNVVNATSDNPNLAVYAVEESDGNLELLVINKSPSGPITGAFSLSGFTPATSAQFWQYGEAQDTAQEQSPTGASALAGFTAALNVSGSSFSYAFPAYSMTVVDLSPAPTNGGPTLTIPATAAPNPVKGTTTQLSVGATDMLGASSLTYTWSVVSPSPAGAAFSVNGSNAAAQTTVTFAQAGNYTFKVVVTDSDGNSIASEVAVPVAQSITSIRVTPPNATIAAGGTQAFGAILDDQFGDPIYAPVVFHWAVASGIGSINPQSGLYTAPDEGGTAVVVASLAGASGAANITITPPVQLTPLSASIHYTDSADWRSGFVGDMMITNTGANPIEGWTLQFTFTPKITAIWGATIVNRSGKQYTIQSDSFDADIAPGGSESFGFQGAPGRAQSGPSGLILNGVPIALSAAGGSLNARASFEVTSQSKSGYTGSITIVNMGTIPIGGWALQFNFAPKISVTGGASIARHSGSTYIVRDIGTNGLIAPGASASFSLKVARGKFKSGPGKYVLDGIAIV